MSAVRPVDGASRRSRTLVALAVVALYLLLAALVFWPVGPFDASRLPDGFIGDPDELTWFLAWTPWALVHGHNVFLTHAIDVPFQVNLADNTSMPLLGVLGSPVTALLGPIAAYNALLRLALAASASAAFLCFRRFSRGTAGAAIGGLLYGFSPAIVSHLQTSGHLDLVFAPFPPLLLWLLVTAASARRSPWLVGGGIGLVAAAQYLVGAELLADCGVLAVLAAVVFALACRSRIRAHVGYLARAAVAAVASFAVVAGYPIALLIDGPGHLSGPVQATAHLQRFRTDLLQPVVPDLRQWLDPLRLHRLSDRILTPVRKAGGAAELGGYLGIPLLLLVGWLLTRLRRRREVWAAFALAVAAFVLSLGSRLQVDGHSTAFPLPEALLAHLPLLDSDVPARYALFVVLALGLIVAMGVDEAILRWSRTRRVRPVAAAALVVLVGLTLVSLAPRVPVSAETTAVPPGLRGALTALVPRGSTVLAYPYPQPPYAGSQLWQAIDGFGFRLLGAYATIRTPSGESSLAPPLTQPAYVQEFLAAAEDGRHSHYPQPGAVSDPTSLLCDYLLANGVDVVLFAPSGAGAGAVRRWFTDTLGPPHATRAGITAWDVRPGHCPAA